MGMENSMKTTHVEVKNILIYIAFMSLLLHALPVNVQAALVTKPGMTGNMRSAGLQGIILNSSRGEISNSLGVSGVVVKINQTGQTIEVKSTREEAQASVDLTVSFNNLVNSAFGGGVTTNATEVMQLRNTATGDIEGFIGVAFTEENDPPIHTPPPHKKKAYVAPDLKVSNIKLSPKGVKGTVEQNKMEAGVYTPKVVVKNINYAPTDWNQQEYSKSIKFGSGSTYEGFPLVKPNASYDGVNSIFGNEKVYNNGGHLGKGGTFPVVLRIKKAGWKNYVEVEKKVGPLSGKDGGYDTVTVTFPEVTLPAGDYEITAVVDPQNGDYSCDGKGDEGCINEQEWGRGSNYGDGAASNALTETLKVTQPNLKLGTYLLKANEKDKKGSESYKARTITDGDEVGLFWRGPSIDFSQCTGSITASDGTTHNSFSGKRTTSANTTTYSPSFLKNTVFARNFDRKVEEPPTDMSYLYTQTCKSAIFDTDVSDSVLACNGDCDGLTLLEPTLPDMTVKTGEEVTSIPFSIANQTDEAVTDVTYELLVGTDSFESGTYTDTIPAGESRDTAAIGSWTAPDTEGFEDMSLTIAHSGMPVDQTVYAKIVYEEEPRNPACDDGEDNDGDGDTDYPADSGCSSKSDDSEADAPSQPQCSDHQDNDGDYLRDLADPDCTDISDNSEDIRNSVTMTVTPSLVHRGEIATVTWTTDGIAGCVLSSNLASYDASTDGTAESTIGGYTIFSIDCTANATPSNKPDVTGNLYAEDSVRVLPSVEEN